MLSRLFASGLAAAVACSASATITTLTFEGLPNLGMVGNYYDGGSAENYGVDFVGNALAIISGSVPGGTGNFINQPSGSTILFWLDGPSTTMNVAAGFTDGFAVSYSSISNTGSISIYSGLDGTGTELATISLSALGSDPGAYAFNRWAVGGASFSGTAKSVVFNGVANFIAFDDVTFGTNVPAPGAVALLGLGGLAGVAGRRRR